jgi:hypothetical protein
VELVVGLGGSSGRLVFQSRSRGHGVLATDTKSVDELRPGVADDPTVEGSTPRGGKHDETENHDEGILDETDTTTDPVTLDTDTNLTTDDTDNLNVRDGGDPVLLADIVGLPALGPDGLVETSQVTNGAVECQLRVECYWGGNCMHGSSARNAKALQRAAKRK